MGCKLKGSELLSLQENWENLKHCTFVCFLYSGEKLQVEVVEGYFRRKVDSDQAQFFPGSLEGLLS